MATGTDTMISLVPPLLRWLFAPLLCLAALCTQAAETRVALVIGNAAYKEAPLANPVNDAGAMAQALREAGFQVRLLSNADHRATLTALREFGDRLRMAQVGVFYFAGHGMQIKGRNYLIPVGAEILREDEVAYAALDAQAVLDKMESAGNVTNLMILDACRNNPFARSFRSAQQGLAQMDAPVGTLVAFATSPGSVASDGSGQHGLYTDHLLRAMRLPGAKVEDVFKKVRAAVRRDSGGKQVPWEATSLEGDLVLFPAATVPAPAPAAAPALRPADSSDRERRTTELLAELATARPPTPAPVAHGARPPARNGQGYTVGDRWNYQVIDKQRGEVVRNYGVRVARLLPDGGWVSGGDATFDELGRLVRWVNDKGEKRHNKPHSLRWWAGMVVGEKRRFEVDVIGEPPDGKPWLQQSVSDARVVALETVKVPAGEFSAYRVEHEGNTRNVGAYGYGTFKVTLWYAPELHTWVAQETRSIWNGKLDTDLREELTSYALVGSR
jgi:hypothetical protein